MVWWRRKRRWRVEVVVGAARWHWRLRSLLNGEIVAHSEMYGTRRACLHTAELVLADLRGADLVIVGDEFGGKP